MGFWTYILHCNGGRFYTGHAENLEQRVADHQAGRFAGFTRNFLPVELVWSQEFATRDEAKAAERRIKGWSRAKKLALIPGDWAEISRLAKQKGSPSTGSGQTDIVIVELAFEAMRTAAETAQSNEACGILLGDDTTRPTRVIRFIGTRNVHPTPETHFEIDPQALIDTHRQARLGGPMVVGYFHSHPTGPPEPSVTDAAMAAGDGRIWAIAGTSQCGQDVRLWRDDANGFTPLSYALANR